MKDDDLRPVLNITYEEELEDGTFKVVICNSRNRCMPAVLAGTRALREEETKFKSGLKWISVKSIKRGAFDPASLFPDMKNPNVIMGLITEGSALWV